MKGKIFCLPNTHYCSHHIPASDLRPALALAFRMLDILILFTEEEIWAYFGKAARPSALISPSFHRLGQLLCGA